jgi:hypothetical protein
MEAVDRLIQALHLELFLLQGSQLASQTLHDHLVVQAVTSELELIASPVSELVPELRPKLTMDRLNFDPEELELS